MYIGRRMYARTHARTCTTKEKRVHENPNKINPIKKFKLTEKLQICLAKVIILLYYRG